jgi:hypothetical protein
MAQLLADVAGDTTTTTGTGAKTLAGVAPLHHRTLAAAGAVTADTVYLRISHATLDEWEIGNYTYNSTGPTITRIGTPLASSNAGAAVNFSAGTKNVRHVMPADALAFAEDVAPLSGAVSGTDTFIGIRAGVPYSATVSALPSGGSSGLTALGLWDFWYLVRLSTTGATAPDMFAGAAVSSGTNTTAIPAAALAGFNSYGVFLRSGTTANGGYKYQTTSMVADYFGTISHKFRAQFLWRTAFTGRTVRIGYHDSITSADAVDGAYFEILDAVCSAKTASNSVRTTNATTLTLSLDTAYTFDIDVNAAGTEARFRVYGGTSDTALLDVTNTTNIPITSARAFGAGIVATEASTTASDIGILYSLGMGTVEGFARAAGAVAAAPPAATVPAAFVVGNWTSTPGDTQIVVNITALPSDGGSPITALEYTLNGSTWTAFAGTGTGSRTITGLTNGTSYPVQIRAVNAIPPGNGAASDTKNTTPAASSVTLVRFSSLTNMTETGNGTTGWIYTATAANGRAGGSDWNLASGVAGTFIVQTSVGSSGPLVGLYPASTGSWDTGIHVIAYPSGPDWFVNNAAFGNLVTTPRTYAEGDWLRFVFTTGNTFTVDIARTATPTTWLPLGAGTITRPANLYPRIESFGGAAAVFTAPQRV